MLWCAAVQAPVLHQSNKSVEQQEQAQQPQQAAQGLQRAEASGSVQEEQGREQQIQGRGESAANPDMVPDLAKHWQRMTGGSLQGLAPRDLKPNTRDPNPFC